jgi:hypothetical protein
MFDRTPRPRGYAASDKGHALLISGKAERPDLTAYECPRILPCGWQRSALGWRASFAVRRGAEENLVLQLTGKGRLLSRHHDIFVCDRASEASSHPVIGGSAVADKELAVRLL